MKITNNITHAYLDLMKSIVTLNDEVRLQEDILKHTQNGINREQVIRSVLASLSNSTVEHLLKAQERFRVCIFTAAIREHQNNQPEGQIQLNAILRDIEKTKEELKKRYWTIEGSLPQNGYVFHMFRHNENATSIRRTPVALSDTCKALSCISTELYREEMMQSMTLLANITYPDRALNATEAEEKKQLLKKYKFMLKKHKTTNNKQNAIKNHFIKAVFSSAAIKDIVPIEPGFNFSPEEYLDRFKPHIPRFLHQEVHLKSTNLLSEKNHDKLISDIGDLITQMQTKKQRCYLMSSANKCDNKISALVQARNTLFQEKAKGNASIDQAKEALSLANKACQVHTTWIFRAFSYVLPQCLLLKTATSKHLEQMIHKISNDSHLINGTHHEAFNLKGLI